MFIDNSVEANPELQQDSINIFPIQPKVYSIELGFHIFHHFGTGLEWWELQLYVLIFKGYCTSSRINCDMAKSLLLASALAIPQLILEQVQEPYYYIPATSLLEHYK